MINAHAGNIYLFTQIFFIQVKTYLVIRNSMILTFINVNSPLSMIMLNIREVLYFTKLASDKTRIWVNFCTTCEEIIYKSVLTSMQ